RGTLATLLIVIGSAALLAGPLLGLAVRRAIVPRVQRLMRKIERFRELGVHEPLETPEGDELVMLERTLDVGFEAIAARDRERKRFLAIAAHELKTPLTAMKGFAQAALDHHDDPAVCSRALGVIVRNSSR